MGQPQLIIFDWEGTLVRANLLGTPILFPDAKQVLETLHADGCLLAIATAKSKQGLKNDLIRLELQHLFAATCTAEETLSKPHPAMLFNILEQLAITAQNALMIGDTIYDIEMAKRANMQAVAVCTGLQSRAELMKVAPCIDNLIELPQYLLLLGEDHAR